MNSKDVQDWINRTPAQAGSGERCLAVLALGKAFDGLQERVVALPPTLAQLPVIEATRGLVSGVTDLDRHNRRGPYLPRAIRLVSNRLSVRQPVNTITRPE